MTLPNPIEVELAFSIHGDRAKVENHKLLSGQKAKTRQLVGTYFDTPSGVLQNAGWSLRIRSTGDQWVQTIKGPRVMATSPEWEVELGEFALPTIYELDFGAIKQTPLWSLITGLENELHPVFETDVTRISHILQFPNATIETALDFGQIRSLSDKRTMPIQDVELELKDGDVAVLFQCAMELALDSEIMIQPASKAARGYQLINHSTLAATKYDDTKLDKDADTGSCFQAILINVLTHLRRNLTAAYAGHPDGIHQTRVGLRRLRTALRLFQSVLPKDPIKTFQSQLKHFSRVLGEARDWDVFITKTLPAAALDMPKTRWLALAEYAAINKRTEAYHDVHEALKASTFNSLILSIMGWTEGQTTPWAESSPMCRPISETLPRMLNKFANRIEAQRDRLNGSDTEFHTLRKTMKGYRYAIEFADTVYPHKAVRKVLEPCKDIQEVLGQFNDFVSADRLLSILIADTPALAPAVAELLPWAHNGKHKVNRPMPKLLRRLNENRPFWH